MSRTRERVDGGVPELPSGTGAREGRPSFTTIYAALRHELGPGSHWPARSGFEVMVGAVLVQNTAWSNVLVVLERLRDHHALDPVALAGLEDADLRELIRPCGFMTGRSRTLRGLADWLTAGEGVDADQLDDTRLRDSLLGLRGIGPETADVISLYVYGRPRFIWDAYGRRMLSALGYEVAQDYEAARRRLEPVVTAEGLSAPEHQELHWLVLEAGRAARRAGGWPAYAARLGLTGGPWGQDVAD